MLPWAPPCPPNRTDVWDCAPADAPSESLSWFAKDWGAVLYDTAYRGVFRLLGYPGVDAEVEAACDALNLAALDESQFLLDLSCGPGVFTQRLVDSTAARVVAVDFSRAMCERAAKRAPGSAAVVRADVGRLPFKDGSVARIHAAASLHCWPDPARGVSECLRVLAPGGVLYLSTVTLPPPTRGQLVARAGGDVAAARADWARSRTTNAPFFDAEHVASLGLDVLRVNAPCFAAAAARV